jgi:hypothetical protein
VIGEAHLDARIGEPQPRRPALRRRLLVFDLPAARLERGRRLALHRRRSPRSAAEAEHALGERLASGARYSRGSAVVSTTASPWRTMLRHALAERGGDQHLVAARARGARHVAGERLLAVARRDAPASENSSVPAAACSSTCAQAARTRSSTTARFTCAGA